MTTENELSNESEAAPGAVASIEVPVPATAPEPPTPATVSGPGDLVRRLVSGPRAAVAAASAALLLVGGIAGYAIGDSGHDGSRSAGQGDRGFREGSGQGFEGPPTGQGFGGGQGQQGQGVPGGAPGPNGGATS